MFLFLRPYFGNFMEVVPPVNVSELMNLIWQPVTLLFSHDLLLCTSFVVDGGVWIDTEIL